MTDTNGAAHWGRASLADGPAGYTVSMSENISPLRWYLIFGRDALDAQAARAEARPAHLARLQGLLEAGRLKVAGPLPRIDGVSPAEGGVSGSVIVAAFADLAAARDWADADPYAAAGVYASVEILPFLPVLP